MDHPFRSSLNFRYTILLSMIFLTSESSGKSFDRYSVDFLVHSEWNIHPPLISFKFQFPGKTPVITSPKHYSSKVITLHQKKPVKYYISNLNSLCELSAKYYLLNAHLKHSYIYSTKPNKYNFLRNYSEPLKRLSCQLRLSLRVLIPVTRKMFVMNLITSIIAKEL